MASTLVFALVMWFVITRSPGWERTQETFFSGEHFIKALRYFDAQKVDAVLVAGDLFTTGRIRELEFVAEAWNAVFPHDRATDGRPVARLFVTGNHDVEDWTYRLRRSG